MNDCVSTQVLLIESSLKKYGIECLIAYAIANL